MKTIPKYVEKMLSRRRKLAMELMDVCADVDSYIERIGGDLLEIAESTSTGCMIYCEPENAYRVVKDYIERIINE